MNDASTREEPSMDDILASIRRMIAEGEGVPSAAARTSAGAALRQDEDDEPRSTPEEEAAIAGVEPALMGEASRTSSAEAEAEEAEAALAALSAAAAGGDHKRPADGGDEGGSADPSAGDGALSQGLIAEATAAATLASIEALSREVRLNRAGEGKTLEDVVETLLRPILKEWLDRHLPAIVEAKVAEEIARIARRR